MNRRLGTVEREDVKGGKEKEAARGEERGDREEREEREERGERREGRGERGARREERGESTEEREERGKEGRRGGGESLDGAWCGAVSGAMLRFSPFPFLLCGLWACCGGTRLSVRMLASPLGLAASADEQHAHERSLGAVLSVKERLVVLEPPIGVEPLPGSLVQLAAGGRAAVLFSRTGLSFAAQIDGPVAQVGEEAIRGEGNLTFAAREAAGELTVDELLARAGDSQVFAEKVPQSRRAPISQPLHTGVLAIDSLTPIGRGQSMLILGPDTLSPEVGRSSLAHRVVNGVATFAPEVRRVYVTAKESADAVRSQDWVKGSTVLVAQNDAELLIAAQAACTIAQEAAGDALVVIDDLEPLRRMWKLSCAAAEVSAS